MAATGRRVDREAHTCRVDKRPGRSSLSLFNALLCRWLIGLILHLLRGFHVSGVYPMVGVGNSVSIPRPGVIDLIVTREQMQQNER